jgi:thiol:disulfide interchange protein
MSDKASVVYRDRSICRSFLGRLEHGSARRGSSRGADRWHGAPGGVAGRTLTLLVLLFFTAAAQAQFKLPADLQGFSRQSDPAANLKISSRVEISPNGDAGLLYVTAKLGGDWHIYSVTQKDGGPMRSEIRIEPSSQFEIVGQFESAEPPEVRRLEFYDVPVEEHYKQVTWTVPISIVAGIDPQTLVVRGKVLGQICEDSSGCVPLTTLDTRFTARVEGTVQDVAALTARMTRRTPPVAQAAGASATVARGAGAKTDRGPSPIPSDVAFRSVGVDGYQAEGVHAALTGTVQPAVAAPGQTVELLVTATPAANWHIYAQGDPDPDAISQPTLIAVAEPATWPIGAVTASAEPTVKPASDFLPEQRYHSQAVTWRIPITVPADAPLGKHKFRGIVGYQTCSDSRCDTPKGAYFAAEIQIDASAAPGTTTAQPLQFAPATYAAASNYLKGLPVAGAVGETPPSQGPATDIAFDLNQIQVTESKSDSTIYILLVALVGGFLLNFMPCVLPVIGLKIMSFVQQAGEHRGQVFVLNAWYSLGMLAIFWLLATLASAASLGLSDESLGWGEQFNYSGFTITLLCVVFAMGLSFIGVWEIPIPGFVGSGKAGNLAQKEGIGGAFFKGVLTTILATPCSGPGIATALTWSAGKPPFLVYLVFTFMGLGMAAPYLIIGAFPRLVRFIPKPGAWMDTFKQLMGFVLMGTVVYMFTLVDEKLVIPTLALIFAIWAACWWIGRTPITATGTRKMFDWLVAAGFAAVVGWFAFGYKPDTTHELPWQEFSLAALDEHVQADRTVMIDFTARWCPTCKVLERSVLNTKPVQQMVDKNEVVTLVADWSDGDEEIGLLLEALGSKQLPVIAIFPAGDAYRPQKLTGLYTRSELLGKLRSAGPSTSPRLAEK